MKSSSTSSLIFVSPEEYELRKGEDPLTEEDVQQIIENKDVFKKYIQNQIYNCRSSLANLKCKGGENDVYVIIDAFGDLLTSIDESENNYIQHKEKERRERIEKELAEKQIKEQKNT